MVLPHSDDGELLGVSTNITCEKRSKPSYDDHAPKGGGTTTIGLAAKAGVQGGVSIIIGDVPIAESSSCLIMGMPRGAPIGIDNVGSVGRYDISVRPILTVLTGRKSTGEVSFPNINAESYKLEGKIGCERKSSESAKGSTYDV
jgi:hypothetical protein